MDENRWQNGMPAPGDAPQSRTRVSQDPIPAADAQNLCRGGGPTECAIRRRAQGHAAFADHTGAAELQSGPQSWQEPNFYPGRLSVQHRNRLQQSPVAVPEKDAARGIQLELFAV
jgi:hypothetical protein